MLVTVVCFAGGMLGGAVVGDQLFSGGRDLAEGMFNAMKFMTCIVGGAALGTFIGVKLETK